MMEEKRQLTPADKAKCKWTQEEEYYLQDKWGEVSIKGIAKTLGRSENAIIVRAQRMGLGAHLHADSRVTANQLRKAARRMDDEPLDRERTTHKEAPGEE